MTPNSEREQRAIAAYLGLAIGDALGATVEFMTPREIALEYGSHQRIIGGGWLKLRPGEVTDDTTMSLALGEAILSHGGFDAEAIAARFSNWMRGKPVDIGNTVRRGLIHYRTTGQPAVEPNEHDAGNGACMRSLPVALATLGQPPAEIISAARCQAHTTHNNPLSDAGTECVIAMVQQAIIGETSLGSLRGLSDQLVADYPLFRHDQRREENPSGFIVHTLRAVFQGVYATNSFERCLVEVVNRGGDADTTGAIAGMIAGALYGRAAIPRRWVKALNPEVREACAEQAVALLALAPSN